MQSINEKEIYLLITIGIGIMLALALTFVFYHAYIQRKLLLKEVENKNILLQKTIMAQEEERKRIAKDLHDEIGSKLNVLFLYFQRLMSFPKDSETYMGIQGDIVHLLHSVIGSSRDIAHQLLPPTLEELGLQAAMIELGEIYTRIGSIEVDIRFTPEELTLKNSILELNVFRIIQELTHNSLQHGKASLIDIHFLKDIKQLSVTYTDNGEGFDTDRQVLNKGLGMRNIESRLHIVKGSWAYQSSPGEGMQAQLTIPMPTSI